MKFINVVLLKQDNSQFSWFKFQIPSKWKIAFDQNQHNLLLFMEEASLGHSFSNNGLRGSLRSPHLCCMMNIVRLCWIFARTVFQECLGLSGQTGVNVIATLWWYSVQITFQFPTMWNSVPIVTSQENISEMKM